MRNPSKGKLALFALLADHHGSAAFKVGRAVILTVKVLGRAFFQWLA
jgi:hypothetical protein